MNTNAVSLLEQYDLEVLRTWRGRGAFICEASQGLFILKEYNGSAEKVAFQERVLHRIEQAGFAGAEKILPDREGNLVVTDQDGAFYVCKTYVEGRECDIRNREEVLHLSEVMARLHKVMLLPIQDVSDQSFSPLQQEFEKRDRELRKVRKFLKNRGQKTEFELFLSQNYEPFFKQAIAVSEKAASMKQAETADKVPICHGDMQHHNLILHGRDAFVQGFEKCGAGNQMRDLYRFMRKYFEKNGWSVASAHQIIEHYQKEKTMTKEDFEQLYLRFAYPEKFWKIVNYYYNKGKSWVPGRNGEKFQALIAQETDKQLFLKEFERYL